MPPIFETDEDRNYQDRCAWILEYIGYTVTPTETVAPWDFEIGYRGSPHALAEYKRRKRKYDPLKIDVSKIDALIDAAVSRGVLPILIIEWPDGRYFWQCHKNSRKGTMLRTANGKWRNETTDTVYEIPVSEFRRLK